jgi:RHS repeat-associated protein
MPQDPSTCTSPRQPATVRYYYDDQGTRVVKIAGPQHIYPNKHFSERNGTGFKHIHIGDTRLLTKTVKPETTLENHVFYFHPDHLGSSGYVTDEHSNLTEHLEYFASGETWVNEHPAQPTPVPYQYGGKELDEETGLYYYGARYYNPRTSLWQSPDPALPEYLDGQPNNGVFAPVNLALYTYAANNPIKFTDPNGLWGLVGHQHTPHAAALAVGFTPTVARTIGAAAWAPDTDDRSATHYTSIFGGAFLPNGADQRVIHLLTGENAAAAQRRARANFQQVIDNMDIDNPTFNREQENILHAFGDSFSHVNLRTAGMPNCPCMYEGPVGHAHHGHRPDDPQRNPGQYRLYLEGLYDTLAIRAQRARLTPRMTRTEFIDTMMRDVAGRRGERRQIEGANAIITRMEAQSP